MAAFKTGPWPKVERCELTDLWPQECACKNHRNVEIDTSLTDGLLIQQFINDAKYDGTCAIDPKHKIEAGTPIAMVVEERPYPKPFREIGYCCQDCRRAIEKYWEDLTDEDV